MPSADGGLGTALVGEKISVNNVQVIVSKLLGEGGFAYVYLVKEIGESGDGKNGDDGKKSKSSKSKDKADSKSGSKATDANPIDGNDPKHMVLKVTSILSKQQREIAEKEATLLARMTHPSIIKVFDTCYRTIPATTSSTSFGRKTDKASHKEINQHLILMEYCEGGHAMGICTQLRERGEKFDLSSLIIAFGQICNAVSYLHAQRPPIVHRDLKPENFLIKNGAYKLCDFGSAVFGHIELKTSQARAEAEEEIQKTTTQMFRAPEMVDLFMAKKLTQATDVWALGCCLYSLAFLQNCFEEGSNLAILSRKYKIPEDNPYGEGLVELIDRMLTIDSKARADMTEVILCLSAVYSNRPLPPRKEKSKKKKEGEKDDADGHNSDKEKKEKEKKKSSAQRSGSYRTDGQGVYGEMENLAIDPKSVKGPKEAKKLDPNSAAARRRQAAGGDNSSFAAFDGQFDKSKKSSHNDDLAFSTTDNPFAHSHGDSGDVKSKRDKADWTNAKESTADAALDALTKDTERRGRVKKEAPRDVTKRSRSRDVRRAPRRPSTKPAGAPENEHDDEDEDHDDHDDDQSAMAEHPAPEANAPEIKVIQSRGVRRVKSGNAQRARSRSRGVRRTPSQRMKKDGEHDDDDDDDDDDDEE